MKQRLFFFSVMVLSAFSLPAQSTITFVVEGIPTEAYQSVGIRGSIAPLSWQKSLPLTPTGDSYSVQVDFPDSEEELEFKFVLFNDDTQPNWEAIQNRSLSLEPNEKLTSTNHWNREQVVDLSAVPPIPSEGLLKDFELIKTMVNEVHPGTYRYNSKAEIEQALGNLEALFQAPLSHGAAYLHISKLTAALQCDHTRAGFNNQNRLINSVIHYQKDKVPFTFRWINQQMIVLRNASESDRLQRGTRITSINGIAVEEIKRQLLGYMGADGATDANRDYKLEVNGYDFRYNGFDIFYPLQYPFVGNRLQLHIQPYGREEVEIIEVSTLTREERSEILAERYEDFPRIRDDMWSFEVLQDSIAVLRLNSFGLYGWKALQLDYKAYLADVFQQLQDKGIPHLILDIRENTGGNDEIADELFSYLTPSMLDFQREGRTRYLTFPESLKPYVQSWGDNPWYFQLDPADKTPTDGYYRFPENFEASDSKNDKELFSGKVYLLSSSANTSLAYYTARRFQLQELGPIIGQETGGNLNDINGGQILFLRLPESQIEIDFPVMGGFTKEPQPNQGVRPDQFIRYSLEDVVEKRDLEMEAVLRLIQE